MINEELISFLLPSGVLGSIAGWWISRRLRNVREKKEEQTTLIGMIHELNELLSKESTEKNTLYKVVSKLERALSRIGRCPYREHCPVRLELREQEEPREQQRKKRRVYKKPPANDTTASGEEDLDRDPAESVAEPSVGGSV